MKLICRFWIRELTVFGSLCSLCLSCVDQTAGICHIRIVFVDCDDEIIVVDGSASSCGCRVNRWLIASGLAVA